MVRLATLALTSDGLGAVALDHALCDGAIAAATLDDLEEDPAKQREWKPSNPLLQHPNAIVPHSVRAIITKRVPMAAAPETLREPHGVKDIIRIQ